MRVPVWGPLLCVLTLLAMPAAAQSTTEDGIRAVVRGDYQAAARILKPLADNGTRPDPVAQFFLAILYHTGQSVVRDELRACGLFLRSAAREHPFSQQSAALAGFAQQLLGDGAARFCVQDERWQGGPPVSFQLGPGHRIVFADTNITVTYEEREQRMLQLLPAGAAFLPIRHTPLDVTRPIPARRNFFQLFHWVPDRAANPSSWTLVWWLGEVAGEIWIGHAGELNLAVVNGATPPASGDLANLVRLQVNANGEAQYTIVGGPAARTEVIPTVRIP
jgi:hypothetical protein